MSDVGGGGDPQKRLESLEREVRVLRASVVLSSLVLGGLMLGLAWWVGARSDGRTHFDTVEAEHFIIRDSLNAKRGELGMWHGIAQLVLGNDSPDSPRIAIGTGPQLSPQLVLRRSLSGPSIIMTTEPMIHLSNSAGGGGLAALGIWPDGAGKLILTRAADGSVVVVPDSLLRHR